jgi:hypothetical protein
MGEERLTEERVELLSQINVLLDFPLNSAVNLIANSYYCLLRIRPLSFYAFSIFVYLIAALASFLV